MAQGSKKNQKFGRNKRAPTSAGQLMRSQRNKRMNIERAGAEKVRVAARKKAKGVVRGAARMKRREGMPRKSSMAG